MTLKCNECGKFLRDSEGVTCPSCKKLCHKHCIQVSSGGVVAICTACKLKQPRPNTDSTPCRGTAAATSAAGGVANPAPTTSHLEAKKGSESDRLARAQAAMMDEMRGYINSMKDDLISKMQGEFQELRNELTDLRGQFATYDQRIGDMEQRMTALEQHQRTEVAGGVEDVVQTLQKQLNQLQLDLDDRDQDLLLNDLEFSGVPEERGESVTHLVLGCALTLGVKLDERDLVSCERVGSTRADAEGAPARPRTIAVRLARRGTRDELLKQARVRRGATTEGLGLRHEVRRFYTNERLTKKNRALHYHARQRGEKCGWRYVWTRDGRVYARKEHGSRAFRIRSESDLERVFGSANVSPTRN